MTETASDEIPYERDIDPLSSRMCGPASLCMVYRSFGIKCSQGDIATKVAKPGASGAVGARTMLVAQDALARGLGAIVFRAKDPIRTLRAAGTKSVRLILNHRPRPESPAGHFTVLVRVDGEHVVVHDPQIGPNRRIPHTELLELWKPRGAASDITGNVLVAISKERQRSAACPKCQSVFPEAITCPGCRKPIPLDPTAALGCLNASCAERTWEILFCPHCDMGVTNPAAQVASALPTAPGTDADEDPLNLQELGVRLDGFFTAILACVKSEPPAFMQDAITALRKNYADLLEFQKKDKAERAAKAAQPPPAPSQRPPAPPAAEPRPPVDWNELGRKLVEETGAKSGDDQAFLKDSGPQPAPPEQPGLPSPPAAPPATPLPAAQARKPQSQDEPARVEYEPPNWDTLDVRE